RNSNTPLTDQSYRLKLELAAELPSLHSCSPIGENTLSRCPPNRQQATSPKLMATQIAIQPNISAKARHPVGPKPSVSAARPMKAAGSIAAQPNPVPIEVFCTLFPDRSIARISRKMLAYDH
ncbi:MAG TPA: hypothetical protein VF463_12390, partial [Sphingobium sp.]